MSDPLPQDLASALQESAERRGDFGGTTYYFAETGSTNDVAAALAEHGAASGTMVVASAQTAGRGRLGRHWHSPPDAGLYVSLVIRAERAAPLLTLAGGVAVARGVIQATALPVHIKWPNDIVVPDTARPSRSRKLAGILAEASSGPAGVLDVILGFGVNLRSANFPPELRDRATSLEAELGRDVDGWTILVETLVELNTLIVQLESGSTARVLDEWRALAPASRGSLVEVATPAGQVEGIAAGIDDTGALLVRVGERTERVIAGEVVWK
jgi:BirA family transcriptional regulator, biotin operon repressor / biotin---[acetyl-CoA-carboxylase] ligase